MATITLYMDKLNGVGGLIDDIIKSSNNLDTQLGTLKSTLQGVSNSTYNLQDTVNSISSSSKTEKEKVSDLKKLNKQVTEFITTTVKRDNSARDEINKSKKDFYAKYNYLKPDCEKNAIEKVVDKVEKAAKWCAKHWKLIATAVIVVVAVALIATGVGAGIGGTILVGACWGAITGAVIGGVAGGLESMSQGGSFLDGFEDGAFSGAVGGAIGGTAFAGLGVAGSALGKGISCASKLGKVIKGTAAVSKVLSLGMAGFDMISLADMAIDNKNNPIADLNKKLHSSKAYNIFQTSVSALAVFTGGMTTTMACFVAGVMVVTIDGLSPIDKLKVGDKVLALDAETLDKNYKNVEVIYKRKVDSLVHLIIDDEEIITTKNHPFYVKERGFVEATLLCIGNELLDSNGDIHLVNDIYREKCIEDNYVYNIKVEDYHTYFVGNCGILVHNKNCPPHMNEDGTLKPNQEYTTGENGYTYKTDSNGNIVSAHADELKFKTHNGRLKHNPNTADKLPGDDAGHIFADQFGGSPELDNLVSQRSTLNRAVKGDNRTYRAMEKSWADAMNNGKKVTDIDINLAYSEGSSRPSRFDVSYKIDGKFEMISFKN